MSGVDAVDTSVVVETYNCLEGTSLNSLRASLAAATSFTPPPGGIEILLADVTRDPKIRQMLEREFPEVRRLDALGFGYDEAKALAACEARGRYIVFLDSDCLPAPGWFEKITAPLRDGLAVATGGAAHYPGGFFRKIYSLMDFGFLVPHRERVIGCYASNNSAFVREVLLEIPEPDGPMRCRCYAHAQELARRGRPVMLVEGASVTHEAPPFFRERLRQGYDMVASCWVNPQLPEAQWLRYGLVAAPLFYLRRVRFDWRPIRKHSRELGFGTIKRTLAYPLVAFMRIIDLAGMAAALVMGIDARKLVDPPPRAANWSLDQLQQQSSHRG